jgi:folylpolyglutamate synthase/dihydropteroate synthase
VTITTLDQALNFLLEKEIIPRYNLENILRVIDIFNHPEKDLKIIHITGTN